VVFAATSLTEAFDTIGAQFQAAHPGVTVKFNYNGSSSLATFITQGAPADVFASAAPSNMKTVTDAGLPSGSLSVPTQGPNRPPDPTHPRRVMGAKPGGSPYAATSPPIPSDPHGRCPCASTNHVVSL